MIELLRKRRSIRKYSEKPIEVEKIEILKECCLRSPTSRNIEPCEFIFVTNQDVLNSLSKAKAHGSAFLSDAHLGIVVVADQTASDVWVEDASIASALIQLTAQTLNLGSCWIQIRNRYSSNKKLSSEDYIRDILYLPEKYAVESIISIGYPAEKREGRPAEDLKKEKIKTI
jgi:nitroreductase